MSAESTGAFTGRWVVTATGMVASFTMVLSGTIVNVAVPDVMGTFGVGQGLAQFLATAYLATMTASQLLGAWITGCWDGDSHSWRCSWSLPPGGLSARQVRPSTS